MRAIVAELARRGEAGFGAQRREIGRGSRRARTGDRLSARRARRRPAIRRSPAPRPISSCSASRSAARASPRPGSPRRTWRRAATIRSAAASPSRASSPRSWRPRRRASQRSILSGAGALEPYESMSGGDGMSEFVRIRREGAVCCVDLGAAGEEERADRRDVRKPHRRASPRRAASGTSARF